MTRAHASSYASPADPYAPVRCPDCKHLRYADEKPGDPCRWCGPSCADHETLIERTRRVEGSLKRGGRLQRRTRLATTKRLTQKTPLRSVSNIARVTPLKAISTKRRRANRVRRDVAYATFGDAPDCAVPGCPRPANDIHEPLTRARGGSITDPANMAPLCRPHHTEITDTEPAWAYDLGLLVHSWDGGDAA